MNPKLMKLLGIAGLPLIVLLWFFVVFSPSMVELNQAKRELKDLSDAVKQNMNAGEQFEPSDQQERERFRAAESDLRTTLPRVEGSDGFLRLITGVSAFLKQSAADEGLSNLIVSSNSQDLEINAQTLPQAGPSLEELLLFTSNRLREIQVESERRLGSAHPKAEKGPFGLASHVLFVTFSGDLRSGLSFLHRLPFLDRSLRVERLVVSEGKRYPLFLVHARLYYWDATKKPAGQALEEDGHAQE